MKYSKVKKYYHIKIGQDESAEGKEPKKFNIVYS